eukprot:gene5350-525_t
MRHCIAYGCTPKVRAAATADGKNISFHKFPEDKAVRKAWLVKIKRENFVPSRHSRVCSLHFTNESFLRSPVVNNSLEVTMKAQLLPDAVPTLFVYNKVQRRISGARKKRIHSEVIESALASHQSSSNAENELIVEETTDRMDAMVTADITDSVVTGDNDDDAKKFVDVSVQTDSCNCRCFCFKEDDVLSQESTIESTKEIEESDYETDESDIEESEESDIEYEEIVDVSQIPLPAHKDRYFLIPQTILLTLFQLCLVPGCLKSATAKIVSIIGTMVKISVSCAAGHETTWHSQKYHQQLPIGNLLASAAVFLSGSSIAKANEVKSSYHMELEGLKRGLQYMQDANIHIAEVVIESALASHQCSNAENELIVEETTDRMDAMVTADITDSVVTGDSDDDDAKKFVDVSVQTESCNCRCFCFKEDDVLSQESTIESTKEIEESDYETDDSDIEESEESDIEYEEIVDVSQIPLPAHKDRYFLIPQTILLTLFQLCLVPGCLKSATAKIVSIIGTMVKISVSCAAGHETTWHSQKYHQQLPIGNLLASAAVFLSGSSIAKANEVKSSYHMELEGLKRGLQYMQDANIHIAEVVTDRHLQIKKYMRTEHTDKKHSFDCWHICKGVESKLTKAGQKKGASLIQNWIKAIVNHIYWIASTSGHEKELKKEKWLSVLNHMCNIHAGHGDLFPNCAHGDIDERDWIIKDYAEKLIQDVLARREAFPTLKEAALDIKERQKETPPPLTAGYATADKDHLIAHHRSRFSITY